MNKTMRLNKKSMQLIYNQKMKLNVLSVVKVVLRNNLEYVVTSTLITFFTFMNKILKLSQMRMILMQINHQYNGQ